jgi:glutathione synthase/RimK-type ligase-like ATP-grasp enzyme
MKYKRIILFPYSIGSAGAKAVAANLTTMEVECLRVYGDRNYSPKDGDFIMGWGSGHLPEWLPEVKKVDCTFINTPDQVNRSIDKRVAFRLFKENGVPTPRWSLKQEEAVKWSKDGHWICVRQSVEGMDGRGLILAKKPEEIAWAQLYTQYIPNEREFRIYVFDGKVIDVLEKKPDDDATDQYIRTESNHYIYIRPHHTSLPGLKEAAIAATEAIGLTFAGIDLVYGDDGKPYVLETNTAPGIGQITARRIAEAIKEYAGL